jgi:hypothetical protein
MAAWFTALINLGGLWAGVATQAYLASNMIVVMSLVNETDWVPTPGEQYAIYLGIIVFGLGSSLVSGIKFTRRLDSSMTWVSILGLGAFAITILAMAKPKASAVSDRMWTSAWRDDIDFWTFRALSLRVSTTFQVGTRQPSPG